MAKQDKRKSNKRGSQSQSTTKKTSESAKKKTDSTKKTSESAKKKTDSVITRGATSRSDSRTERTDSRPTPSFGASRKRGNASQSLAATQKRKTTDSSTQHGSKRQKTRPLTTADVPAIVKAARDGLPEPTETSQDSDDLEDTQDTDVAISDSSDEFGTYNLRVVYNCVCISRLTVVRRGQETTKRTPQIKCTRLLL